MSPLEPLSAHSPDSAGGDARVGRYFLRSYGQHGFTSNGIVYPTVAAAAERAREVMALNPSIIGCEIRGEGETVRITPNRDRWQPA